MVYLLGLAIIIFEKCPLMSRIKLHDDSNSERIEDTESTIKVKTWAQHIFGLPLLEPICHLRSTPDRAQQTH